MKNSLNPFPVSGYQGPAFFCNREEEIKTITGAIENGRNLTLVALRRVGKTALVYHLFHLWSKKKWNLLYVDLMPTNNLSEFAARLATALSQAAPQTTTFGKKVWTWLKSVRPQITFDPYTGLPQISFDLDRPHEQQSTLLQLFNLLEENEKRTIIALDEFQQITQYPQKQTEGWLRSHIQNLKNVSFIFCGSQQQLLMEMFNSAKRPFYASTQMLSLPFLNKPVYSRFIAGHFKNARIKMADEDVDYILEWCRLHTFYVQTLCNRLYMTREKTLNREHINRQIDMVFQEQEAVFFTFRELHTVHQWALLSAIAKEGRVFAPTSNDFLKTHDLGPAATVKRSLESLLLSDMVFRQFDEGGHPFYQVYDVFLSRWLEQKI